LRSEKCEIVIIIRINTNIFYNSEKIKHHDYRAMMLQKSIIIDATG